MNEMKQKASLWVVHANEPPDGDYRLTSSDLGNEHLYCYRFLGGKKGRGHLSSRIGDPTEYELELRSEGYVIAEINFHGDAKQLVHTNKGKCTSLATISNANKKVMQGYYHVIVRRESTGELIDCDPMISNEPKA